MLELDAVSRATKFISGAGTASRDLDSRFSLMEMVSEEVVASSHSEAVTVQCQKAKKPL